MQTTFRYENSTYLNITSMSLIGSFNNYDMEKGKMKLIQNEWTYTTEIKEGEYLYMYSKITDEQLVGSKKQFNLIYDNQVCVMFKFTNIIGIHHVSIVWMSPLKSILKIEEYPVYINNASESNETSLLSVLSFNNDWNTFHSKGWLARLFVNGSFILEDEFEVHSSTEYSSLGRYK